MTPASIALIEIGSNQVWFIAGHYEHPKLHIIHESSAPLRLGGALTPEGDLPTSALDALMAQLQAWLPLWQSYAPEQRRVISTQVLREARNQALWQRTLRELLRCDVHIIDGQQEAAWGYAGAMLQQSVGHATPCLVVDIGGRSTEVSQGHGTQWHGGQSFAVGAVSWSQRYFAQGLTASAFEQAIADARWQLAALQQPEWQQLWTQCYGIAGVAQALAHVLQQLGNANNTIPIEALVDLQEQLCISGMSWLRKQCQLAPGLEPMLGGCISTMQALMETLQISQLQFSTGALRHGLLQAANTSDSSLAQRL